MVKLASAREIRLYGTRLSRNRLEYINAGLYVFATILLLGGFIAQFSDYSAKSGLVVLVISLGLIIFVNLHDLFAHLVGIDYRLSLMGFDTQLALVEFAVPVVYTLGSVLMFLAILFFFIQAEQGRTHVRLGKNALNMLIAGPVLWVIGSIHNMCQVYERADTHVQILQTSVNIPFLMGSLLFLVGAILNRHDHMGFFQDALWLLGKSWVWMGIFGSLLFLVGGVANVVKVFKMQQMDGIRLEKLRGGAQERLNRVREGQVPLILEEQRRRTKHSEGTRPPPPAAPVVTPATPYKDVLVGQP
ncbi:hypothetical protein GIB67_042313 [Kingdonia uniflora]|uniref:Polypyrimidine tract-binding protein n=1 Tax=Kingdonia uniflora TaxID=39325 RepID=A0A7J7LED1_9MAGN|nr:hypothetical protein GIB67_042313 [Kingdonia uniflora]